MGWNSGYSSVKLNSFVLYSSNVSTLLPQASLAWHLYLLAREPLGLSLPSGWGLALAWSLAAIPLTPLVLAALVQLAWVRRGVPISMVGQHVSHSCSLLQLPLSAPQAPVQTYRQILQK